MTPLSPSSSPPAVTRRIGLSLGADICWPTCFEHILRRLDLTLPVDGKMIRVEAERVTIEPFNLRQECRYDVVLDRLTHWYHTSREWIKKATVMNGLYVLNNPWALQSMEKQTSYCAMMRLGLDIPETWMVPPKAYAPTPDLQPTLERYARMFDLGSIGENLGYPLFMKPYDGGGWVGIHRVENEEQLRRAYEESGEQVMHLQRAVENYDLFVRCVGVGPQIRYVDYDPSAPLHDRYRMSTDVLPDEQRAKIRAITLTINSFFGWDFNSAEILRQGDRLCPIDFANACPDSQVTSLHFHFPWLVKALLRWSIFVAVTKRRFRHNPDWQPYYDIADDPTVGDKLAGYASLAEAHFETERFEAFCHEHLSHLDEVAHEFFGGEVAREAVRQKVSALYPAEEIDEYAELFWARIQQWRDGEGQSGAIL
ncbi:MAG: hypothetical protein AAF715_27585 [Myxococcota bacterium]